MLTLKDKFYSCLIGGAVGDALGSKTEGMMYWEIREKFGVLNEMVEDGFYGTGEAGRWTDDTTLGCYLCWKFIKEKRRLTAADFAETILEKLNTKYFWVNEKLIKERLYWGIAPFDAGIGGIACGCGAMGIAPIGMINACNPNQAYQDGMCIASVNSSGENRDIGAMFACAISSAMNENATIDSVLEDIFKYGNYIVQRAVDLTIDLALKSSDTDDFTEKFYAKLADPFYPQPKGEWKKDRYYSANGREYVPVSLALIKMCGTDLTKAIKAAANFGRDCDSIASLTGQVGGAIYGSSSIRKDWVELIEKVNSFVIQEIFDDYDVKSISDMSNEFYNSYRKMISNEIEVYQSLQERMRKDETK